MKLTQYLLYTFISGILLLFCMYDWFLFNWLSYDIPMIFIIMQLFVTAVLVPSFIYCLYKAIKIIAKMVDIH